MEKANPERTTYTVANDPDAVLRASKAYARSRWKAWVRGYADYGVEMVVFGVLVYWGAWSLAEGELGAGLQWVIPISFTCGLIQILLRSRHQFRKVSKLDGTEQWECEISDEAWSFRRRNGVFVSIPWNTMRVVFEHPDGWFLQYGAQDVFVFRKPLQDAGLEEAFRSRVPGR